MPILIRSRLPGKYSGTLLIDAKEIGIKNVFVYYGLTAEIKKKKLEIAIRKSGSSSF